MAANELEIGDKSTTKKKIILAVAAVGVIAVAGGGYFWFFGDSSTSSTPQLAVESASSGSGNSVQGNALYVQLPRPFVFNITGDNRGRLVQIRVQLMVRGDVNQALALRHIPLIEGSLLASFSAANADELVTATGKDELKNKALVELQDAMLGAVGSAVVAEILFTGFVMQ